MKLNIIRCILFILLIETFFVIFGFSNQNAKESSGVSGKITEAVLKNIEYVQKLGENEKANIYHRVESIIRKIAHFSIYAVVGTLLIAICSTYKIKEINSILISFILGFIYASSDEIHQSFIPGRSAQITDVMLDSLGVLFGMFVLLLILKIFPKILQKFNNNSIIDKTE